MNDENENGSQEKSIEECNSNENIKNVTSFDSFEVFLHSDEDIPSDHHRNELFTKVERSRLSKKVSRYLTCPLEDSIRQMLILWSCNKHLKLKVSNDRDFQSPDDQLEKIDYAELASDNHKIAKVNGDRDNLTEVLIKVYLDLQVNRNFASLLVDLSDMAVKAYQSIALELQHNEYRSSLKNLQVQIRTEARINKSTLQNCDLQIHKLRDELADEKWNCKIKKNYVVEWQNAQIDQHTLKIEQAENLSSDGLNEIKDKIELDIKINKEIEKYMNKNIQEFSNKISNWKNKYVEESEQIDNEITEMEKKREEQSQVTEALQKLLENHKKDIQNWISFVEERNKRLERERLLQRSAIVLQSWWRGVLVRRRLAAKIAKDSKKKSAKKKK